MFAFSYVFYTFFKAHFKSSHKFVEGQGCQNLKLLLNKAVPTGLVN